MPFNLSDIFHAPWMLWGLAVLAIPPLIHLLNRRRYNVVDWGAMQFLQVSEVTRRRIFLEELLLMLLRIGLLAVLVFALAGPFFARTSSGPRSNRDVVLLFDGSYSMGSTRSGQTPHDAAREWARGYVNDITPGDTVAILQAREQVVPVHEDPSSDRQRLRESIDKMKAPGGGCDWMLALEQAERILDKSERTEREIILLSDGQRYGWSDPQRMERWRNLQKQWRTPEAGSRSRKVRPRLWVVNLDPNRPKDLPNWALAPLRTNRPIVPANQEVTFRTELELFGQTKYTPPHAISLLVDGKLVRQLPAPKAAKLDRGKIPFAFRHRFATAGSHLVSVMVEPDPPVHLRPQGYLIKDHVPGDNQQDFAIEVLPTIPVLLVDGDRDSRQQTGATPVPLNSRPLRIALSPVDPTPSFTTRVVSINEFVPAMLTASGSKGPAGEPPIERPRVLILHNVAPLPGGDPTTPRVLTAEQRKAIEHFLEDGGGVLVTLGHRAEATAYNQQLYRDGNGFLPARLDRIQGEEDQWDNAMRLTRPHVEHPALDLFRDAIGLENIRFPRWWQVTTPGKSAPGIPIALLRSASATTPFLVERAFGNGRVILCSVALDSSWNTNLTRQNPHFVPLARELVSYLAGARSAEFNLRAGQPLRYRLEATTSLEGFALEPPLGEKKPMSLLANDPHFYTVTLGGQPGDAFLACGRTQESGVYRLKTPEEKTVYYVVQPDGGESDLTPATDKEKEAVAELVPFHYENDRGQINKAGPQQVHNEDLWHWLLVGLIGLLCCEVWMTRRIVKNR
jgi:hypothetical protein